MSVVRNYCPNPSGESASTGMTAVPGTTGVAAVTTPTVTTAFGTKVFRTQWSTASTAAGGGCYFEIVLSAVGLVVGDVISAAFFHVKTSIANRLQMSVEFRTEVGSISTSTNATPKQTGAGTLYETRLAASVDASFKQENLTIPATCTRIRIRMLTVAGTGYANWSIGSQLELDGIQVNKGATLRDYIDGSLGIPYGWDGAVHLSVSRFVTPEITLTPNPAGSPAPYIEVTAVDFYPGAQTVTVLRTVGNRTFKVRGLVKASAAGGIVTTRDFEAPFDVVSSYRVEHFDANGDSYAFSDSATDTLDGDGRVWFHNPTDPTTSVSVAFSADALARQAKPVDVEIFRVLGRSVGVALFGARGGYSQLALDVITRSTVDADRFDALFGQYDDIDTVPILCVRTLPEHGITPTLFAACARPEKVPVNARIGREDARWVVSSDEIGPPAEAIVVALLDYADFTAFFSDFAAFTAAYPDYRTAQQDYSIAGTA